MWPLVQSGDACTFHPYQTVTAHGPHELNKEASEIHVGDVVFRQVQRMQQLFGHIVLRIAHDRHAREPKYWIGNIEQRKNGWVDWMLDKVSLMQVGKLRFNAASHSTAMARFRGSAKSSFQSSLHSPWLDPKLKSNHPC